MESMKGTSSLLCSWALTFSWSRVTLLNLSHCCRRVASLSGWETNLNTADLICGIRCRSTVVCGVTYVVPAYHMHITCISHAYHTHMTCISYAYHMHIEVLINYHICQMLLPVKEVVSLHFGIANSHLVTVLSLSCFEREPSPGLLS